jgi:hypothetical protein
MAVQRLSFLSVQFGLVLAGTTLLSAQPNRGAIEGSVADPHYRRHKCGDKHQNEQCRLLSSGSLSAGQPSTLRLRIYFANITAIQVPAAQVIRVDTPRNMMSALKFFW